MENWWRWGILMALYLPLILIPTVRPSDGKELRPSDHGLTNGSAAPVTDEAKSPQMSSFFGAGVASSTRPLPEARNFTDSPWRSGDVAGGDHVRKVLMVSSLVCGIAGVVLLVVAGFVFLRRFRNHKSSTSLVLAS